MSNNLLSKQIFAMGGGGFSMEPKNPLLDFNRAYQQDNYIATIEISKINRC